MGFGFMNPTPARPGNHVGSRSLSFSVRVTFHLLGVSNATFRSLFVFAWERRAIIESYTFYNWQPVYFFSQQPVLVKTHPLAIHRAAVTSEYYLLCGYDGHDRSNVYIVGEEGLVSCKGQNLATCTL